MLRILDHYKHSRVTSHRVKKCQEFYETLYNRLYLHISHTANDLLRMITFTVPGKNFTFQQSYHKHLLYHSDDKPHICSTCGRAFKELSTLHNHERIHSGEVIFFFKYSIHRIKPELMFSFSETVSMRDLW